MQRERPMISVVIPSYNRAETICGSLDSVLAQSLSDLEVIVVDDGSWDDTKERIMSYTDNRIKYYRYEPNKGACYARNYGASHSSGAYLAFQDSDDIWHKDKLKKQMEHLLKSDADFVFCGINRISEKGAKYYYPVNGFDPEKEALEQLLFENRIGTQTMLMKRQVWESVRFDETFKRYQDWDFAIRAASTFKIAYKEEALVDSAVNISSISASVESYPALCRLLEKYREEYEKRPRCLARMYRRMARRLMKDKPDRAGDYYRMSFEIEKKAADMIGIFISSLRSNVG